MLLFMTPRGRLRRCLALVWAVLLLAAPAASAQADARFTRALAGSQSHVEDATSATCPLVHPPDCGLCRHLSNAARVPPGVVPSPAAARPMVPSEGIALVDAACVAVVPWGRAPPLA
jgi:hypothetical protein